MLFQEEGINNFFDKVIVNATKAVNVEGFRIINVSILCKIVGLMSRMSTKGYCIYKRMHGKKKRISFIFRSQMLKLYFQIACHRIHALQAHQRTQFT